MRRRMAGREGHAAPGMKVTVDTSVLVRAVVRDDKKQAEAAAKLLRSADLLAVAVSSLCETGVGSAPGIRILGNRSGSRDSRFDRGRQRSGRPPRGRGGPGDAGRGRRFRG